MYKNEKDRSLCEAGRSKWFPFFSHIYTRSHHKYPFNLFFWKGNTHSTELPLLKEKAELSRLVGKEKSPWKWFNKISLKTILCFNNWYYIVKKICQNWSRSSIAPSLNCWVNYDVNDRSQCTTESTRKPFELFIQHKSRTTRPSKCNPTLVFITLFKKLKNTCNRPPLLNRTVLYAEQHA
jgi:hypothetical protein